LSGISLLTTRGLLPENSFLHGHPVLTHPAIFAAFLILAIATSLPRPHQSQQAMGANL
jgi:hypothetical protein